MSRRPAEYYSTSHLDETGWFQNEDGLVELRDELARTDEDSEE